MGNPIDIGSVASLAVDAGSYVFSSWLQPNCNSNTQRPTTWRAQVQLATDSILRAVYSYNSAGTTPFATGAIHAGSAGTLLAGLLYRETLEARSSVYVNFQPSATTTFQQFWISESGSENSLTS